MSTDRSRKIEVLSLLGRINSNRMCQYNKWQLWLLAHTHAHTHAHIYSKDNDVDVNKSNKNNIDDDNDYDDDWIAFKQKSKWNFDKIKHCKLNNNEEEMNVRCKGKHTTNNKKITGQ